LLLKKGIYFNGFLWKAKGFLTILWLLMAIVGILSIVWRFNAYLWENEEIQMVFQKNECFSRL
jgi:hypothetical protein